MQTTFAQNLLDLTLDKGALECAAAKNDMTASQMAVARYMQSISAKLSPEALLVLRDKQAALSAMDRVAALSVGATADAISAAILSK